jgi:hypothetical protein
LKTEVTVVIETLWEMINRTSNASYGFVLN